MTAKTETAPFSDDYPVVEGADGMRAALVAHSVSAKSGVEISTFALRYPRFIHEQFLAHRMFSRNSASNRAMPVHKTTQDVKANFAHPTRWGLNQPGMQADEEHDDPQACRLEWARIAREAADNAVTLSKLGLHKEIANRPLQMFQFIDVVVTATEWENFFELRSPYWAQPEFRKANQGLTYCMQECLNQSTPVILSAGEWHLPFYGKGYLKYPYQKKDLNLAIQVSVARTARVSHRNHLGKISSVEHDRVLARSLIERRHASPTEHQATPIVDYRTPCATKITQKGVTHIDRDTWAWSNNFRAWSQHRAQLGI